MSEVAEIEVAFVNPKTIKSKAGDLYLVDSPLKDQFAQGMKCQVEFNRSKKKDGSGDWLKILKIVGASHAPSMPKHNYSAGKNPAESKQIAVLAIAKELIGKLPPNDPQLEEKMVYVLECGMRAYSRTLGGVAAQRRDDMDDEIPY